MIEQHRARKNKPHKYTFIDSREAPVGMLNCSVLAHWVAMYTLWKAAEQQRFRQAITTFYNLSKSPIVLDDLWLYDSNHMICHCGCEEAFASHQTTEVMLEIEIKQRRIWFVNQWHRNRRISCGNILPEQQRSRQANTTFYNLSRRPIVLNVALRFKPHDMSLAALKKPSRPTRQPKWCWKSK